MYFEPDVEQEQKEETPQFYSGRNAHAVGTPDDQERERLISLLFESSEQENDHELTHRKKKKPPKRTRKIEESEKVPEKLSDSEDLPPELLPEAVSFAADFDIIEQNETVFPHSDILSEAEWDPFEQHELNYNSIYTDVENPGTDVELRSDESDRENQSTEKLESAEPNDAKESASQLNDTRENSVAEDFVSECMQTDSVCRPEAETKIESESENTPAQQLDVLIEPRPEKSEVFETGEEKNPHEQKTGLFARLFGHKKNKGKQDNSSETETQKAEEQLCEEENPSNELTTDSPRPTEDTYRDAEKATEDFEREEACKSTETEVIGAVLQADETQCVGVERTRDAQQKPEFPKEDEIKEYNELTDSNAGKIPSDFLDIAEDKQPNNFYNNTLSHNFGEDPVEETQSDEQKETEPNTLETKSEKECNENQNNINCTINRILDSEEHENTPSEKERKKQEKSEKKFKKKQQKRNRKPEEKPEQESEKKEKLKNDLSDTRASVAKPRFQTKTDVFLKQKYPKLYAWLKTEDHLTQLGRIFAGGICALLCFFAIFYYSGVIEASSRSWIEGSTSYLATAPGRIDVKNTAAGATPIFLVGTSSEEDLKVVVIYEDGGPVLGVQFDLIVTDPDGEENVYRDENTDGQFYIDGLEEGDHVVSLVEVGGYTIPEPITVAVKGPIEYVKIENIDEIIVGEEDIDSSIDDPTYGGGRPEDSPAPATPSDTVEYVESSSETKTVEVQVPVIRYIGNVGENGRLYYAGGIELSNIVPTIQNGYLTGEYTIWTEPTPEPEPTPEATSVDPPAETPAPTEGDGIGGDIDLFAKDQAGAFIYDLTPVETTETQTESVTVYYGWQTFGGATYYYNKNGERVTGLQVILGQTYLFESDGRLSQNVKRFGIDVSSWNGTIDWNAVKGAGVEFVIIRCGFRGYGSGKIVEDSNFHSYIRGAQAAGLKVGVYFYTSAVNTAEAVEEASAVLELVQGYRLDYPIVFDIEDSGSSARNHGLSRAENTKICIAFCETIRSSGYRAMIYANKYWLESKLSTGQFGSYYIWLAHYTGGSTSSYRGRYEMWQYTSKGELPGISTYVDFNYAYF